MQTIALTIALFAVVMVAMAVGAIFTGRSLRGSCGGPGSCECSEEKRRACAAGAGSESETG
jgi:hypothetical protein